MFINTQNFLQEWESIKNEQSEFNSLYEYALYICGGDFSLFDNTSLFEEIIKNKNKTMSEETKKSGIFFESLKRSNAKIKEDRAQSISEDAEVIYKREVEDTELSIKRLKRERENMLDLSPTTTDSLIIASDFDSKKFVEKDLQIGIKLRELEIKAEILKTRYQELFGK